MVHFFTSGAFLGHIHLRHILVHACRSVSQSEAEIIFSGGRDMGAVKKGVIPKNAPLVKKCTQVI